MMLKVSPARFVADHTTVAKSYLAPAQPQLQGLQNEQSPQRTWYKFRPLTLYKVLKWNIKLLRQIVTFKKSISVRVT
jgi:predicted nucleotidyltransferase